MKLSFSNIFKVISKNKNITKVDYNDLPKHIAIIMDGNGRWAQKHGLPRSSGHKAGSKALKKIVKFANSIGIKVLTVYAFSTENWKRPPKEVNMLMELLLDYLKNYKQHLGGANVVIKVIGNVERLSKEIQDQIKVIEEATGNNTGMILNIAINYGGRSEIVSVVKHIAKEIKKGNINIDEINEDLISNTLYTNYVDDPDLIIRPSGEMRLSNFLLWQCAYSEFWFSNIYWPDFKSEDLLRAISDFQKRSRRFGGV